MNLFPLVWFPSLGGVSYLLYRHYIYASAFWTSVFASSPHDPVTEIMATCQIYLGVEILQFLLAHATIRRQPPPTLPSQATCNQGTHVIIAAHKAYDSLQEILPTVLSAFPADQIWVADNGLEQDTATQQHCQELGVKYRFYDIPNKTFALYMTAREIYDTHHDKATSLVLLDDDTHLPDGFRVRQDLLAEPLVAGYCVGITIKKTPPFNFFEELISYEYETISYRNEIKASRSTIHFLHGICAVYNTRTMLMIFSKLCTLPGGLPFGEDSFAGIDCRLAGYRLLQDNTNVVSTFCPRRFFPPLCAGKSREQGFGASSLWKQRALRWYLSWPRRLPSELALGLFYDAGSWIGNVAYRLDLLWYLIVVIISSAWPVYLIRVWATHKSWALFGYLHLCLYATSAATASIRYAAFPQSLKEGVDKRIMILVPLFNTAVCFMMAASFFISLLYYIPLYRINYKKCYGKSFS